MKKTYLKCRICNNLKVAANERIIRTRVCFGCAHKIIPKHIPRTQYLKYLLLKGYDRKLSEKENNLLNSL